MDEPRKDNVTPDATAGARVCAQCGAGFVCGIAAGDARCWCFELPAVMPVRADTACLCPVCLLKAIQHVRAEQEIKQ